MRIQTETLKKQKVIIVGDSYRTNPLSHSPGGSTVKVYYPNGTIRIYDKIKNVAAYTRYMKEKFNIVKIETLRAS